jgi:hypothetical protein
MCIRTDTGDGRQRTENIVREIFCLFVPFRFVPITALYLRGQKILKTDHKEQHIRFLAVPLTSLYLLSSLLFSSSIALHYQIRRDELLN